MPALPGPRFQLGSPNARADNAAMGIRTRGLDISINAKRQAADSAERAEARGVIDRWNEQLAAAREMLWSPTIPAALIAGTPWLDVHCPGCGTSRALDLRKVDRHPLASVGTLVLGLRCSWCPGSAPMPKILGRRRPPWARWADQGRPPCQASGSGSMRRRGRRSICWRATGCRTFTARSGTAAAG
jgi:hypothetical protein